MDNKLKQRIIKLASYTIEDLDENYDYDDIRWVKVFANVLATMSDGSIQNIYTEIKADRDVEDYVPYIVDETEWYYDEEKTKTDESENPLKAEEVVDIIEILGDWKDLD